MTEKHHFVYIFACCKQSFSVCLHVTSPCSSNSTSKFNIVSILISTNHPDKKSNYPIFRCPTFTCCPGAIFNGYIDVTCEGSFSAHVIHTWYVPVEVVECTASHWAECHRTLQRRKIQYDLCFTVTPFDGHQTNVISRRNDKTTMFYCSDQLQLKISMKLILKAESLSPSLCVNWTQGWATAEEESY